METQVLVVDLNAPERAAVERAAAVLRGGGLVAFPTETVYGLGANALDAAAVGRIFAAKGRPATNPLIVHVADAAAVGTVAAEWPEVAARLAARFWPGPLTLVLPKRPEVPAAVTGGGPAVAGRVARGEPGASAPGASVPPVADAPGSPLRSPGMLARHYAPQAPLECVAGDGRERVEALLRQGVRVGWVTWIGAGDVPGAM